MGLRNLNKFKLLKNIREDKIRTSAYLSGFIRVFSLGTSPDTHWILHTLAVPVQHRKKVEIDIHGSYYKNICSPWKSNGHLQNTFSDSGTLKFGKKGSLAPQIWRSVIYMDTTWVSVGGDPLWWQRPMWTLLGGKSNRQNKRPMNWDRRTVNV